MPAEIEVPQEADVDKSNPNPPVTTESTTNVTTATQSNGKPATAPNGTTNPTFPPPKTDKPRPHVCATCTRSFARLEHLKRHERSHTKEKPFECPECTRCFARRDLLLRHQQKLHMTNTTARGPRSGRRESVSGAAVGGGAKVRKNSVANANVGGLASNTMRPRANTISDLASLGIYDSNHSGFNRTNPATGLDPMFVPGLQGPMGLEFRGMSNTLGHHGTVLGLPKLDTNINAADISASLRTAPPQANFGEYDLDHLFTPHNTINPAALHFGGASSIPPSDMNMSAFDMGMNQPMPMEDDYAWMRSWNMQMQTGLENEQAIDESSPSRMSSGDSPGDYNDGLANGVMGIPIRNTVDWPMSDPRSQHGINPTAFQLDNLGSGLANLDASGDTVSLSHLHDPTPTADTYFHQAMMQHNGPQQSPPIHTPQHQQQQQQQHPHQQLQHQHDHLNQHSAPSLAQSQPDMMQGQNSQYVGQALSNFGSDSPSISSSSMTGSARQSSVTSMSTDSITDSTRQALLASLSQPSVFTAQNPRKFSQPSVSSPLSPGNSRMAISTQGPTLPSTADIKRYVEAFVQHAHPHLPVVHIPTLSFDTIESAASPQGSSPTASSGQPGGNGGARCLILGMAAIGALYQYDHPASKELFEAAKKMISLYLEERRRADMSSFGNGGAGRGSGGESPLWLVQAMLLTVIYGHHCGDRTLADIASNHIAALVSLARAANLHGVPLENGTDSRAGAQSTNAEMRASPAGSPPSSGADLQARWHAWKIKEERKRVVYAIFILSSLLTTAYNQAPTIMNSEIKLNLPCSEELYNAETAEDWQNRGGLTDERDATSFATALSTLLTASQRSNNGDARSEPELRPSTFGCLVLINALHNYIWETRHRHLGKEWTAQETESMFAHIEPALNAWQVAWKSNEQHKLDRPNPFGLGPLAADSIPLLDLAFVRLFVNLGRTAEAFWRRDFDGMAEQLARGSIMSAVVTASENGNVDAPEGQNGGSPGQSGLTPHARNSGDAVSRRERYLRKAAFYAADSMTVACNYNLTYTDTIAHELPIQSAICFFDCAQVLGEWLTSVQERVGQYLGVVGRDPIDYTTVPAIIVLEAEDIELLQKVEQICASLESKRQQHESLSLLSMDINNLSPSPTSASARNNVDLTSCGLGSKIMRSTAMMLEKAVIWPITHVMAKALEVESTHTERRTEASCQS